MDSKKLALVLALSSLLIIATAIGCGTPGQNFLIPVGGGEIFAFVVNSQADTTVSSLTISAFTVDGSTGKLTAVPNSPFTDTAVSGRGNLFMDIDPSNRFLYVPNRDADSVTVFSIGSTGALSPLGSPFPTGGSDAFAVRVTPNGQFLYVGNQSSDDVSAFSVSASGTLTAIGTPVSADGDVHHMFMDPKGRFLYAGIWGEGYAVNGFKINADGSLTYIPAAFALTGKQPQSGTVDSTGKFLLVTNLNSSTVSVFSIDQTTGGLTEVIGQGSPFATGPRPFHVVEFAQAGVTYMAINNTDDGTISVYSFDANTGKLTPNGAPVDLGLNFPVYMAIHPSANFGYITDANNDNIVGVTVNTSGDPTAITGSPFSGGGISSPAQIVLSH